jgi:hypothetical protein
MCSISAIAAVSNDTMENIVSEIDFNDSISLVDDGKPIAADNEDYELTTQTDDNESVAQSSDDDGNILSKDISKGDEVLNAAGSSKSDLKIVNYTNFVKSGETYYFYLKDLKGNAIANKKLTVSFDGKKYEKTTDNNGMVGISVKSSASSVSMNIAFSGDSQYNAFTKTLKVYIDQYITMTIGNAKLLTNGYLRVYLSGPKNAISGKTITVTIGKKVLTKKTTAEGFIVIKPKLGANTYNVVVKFGNYVVSKKIKCIVGNVVSPLKKSIPTVNGVPDVDVMPSCYVMADNDAQYTLKKYQYKKVIKRDSQCLFLYGKLSKYTYFQTKDCPKIHHVIKREKWNVIERALNTKLVKKNKYNYWPNSITASLKGKSYTYSEVRDIQNTEYTCGPTSASVCSQALRNYYSEKFFQKQAYVTHGVNIPVLKNAISKNGFKTSYFYTSSFNNALKQVAKGKAALIAFLPNHYVSIIDVSPDGKKVLVSNSYGKYDVGGDNKVPTDWVSVKYFKSKFAGIGLVVKLNYKLSNSKKNDLKNFCSSMGGMSYRQNVNERIPDVGR